MAQLMSVEETTLNKVLLRELPYHGINHIQFHGQFNNSLQSSLPTKKYLERLTSIHDLDLFNLNISDNNSEPEFCLPMIRSKYYSPNSFSQLKNKSAITNSFSLFHNNVRSLKRNLENFQIHLLEELNYPFSIIGITETRITQETICDFNPSIPNYRFEFVPTPLAAGGVGMYINDSLNYTVIERCSNEAFQALWIEIQLMKSANIVCGIVYRQHNSTERFQDYFEATIEKLTGLGKSIYLMGDTNINLLRSETCKFAQNFLLSLQSFNLIPTVDKPTRVYNNSATLIDNIFTNRYEDDITSGNIVSDISDHYSQFCIIRSRKIPNKALNYQSYFYREYSKIYDNRFLNELADLHLNRIVSSTNDTSKAFSTFYNKFNKLINKHAPLKQVSNRKAKQLLKPWITKGIKQSIKTKNALYYSGDIDKYKYYRNKLLMLTRLSKKAYYHNYFENNLKNSKKTWEGINNLINRKKRNSKSIAALKCHITQRLSYNILDHPNILNKYFSSVGHSLASKMPNPLVSFTDYLPRVNNLNSFVFNPVTPKEIEMELMSLPANKAYIHALSAY